MSQIRYLLAHCPFFPLTCDFADAYGWSLTTCLQKLMTHLWKVQKLAKSPLAGPVRVQSAPSAQILSLLSAVLPENSLESELGPGKHPCIQRVGYQQVNYWNINALFENALGGNLISKI